MSDEINFCNGQKMESNKASVGRATGSRRGRSLSPHGNDRQGHKFVRRHTRSLTRERASSICNDIIALDTINEIKEDENVDVAKDQSQRVSPKPKKKHRHRKSFALKRYKKKQPKSIQRTENTTLPAVPSATSSSVIRVNVDGEDFTFFSMDEIVCVNTLNEEENDEGFMSEEKSQSQESLKNSENLVEMKNEPPKLPRAVFQEIDYDIPEANLNMDNYIRWVAEPDSKNEEEKENSRNVEEVEYEIDELDKAWLDLINEKRESPISVELLEYLIDSFEKASFLEMESLGRLEQGPSVDEEAVCCICMDGECLNTDLILFCDLCNLAVHQNCYGVPYIPEGTWLCRRCLHSPSREVDCVFCPNKGGAFKQTEDGRFAHVTCALWLPEIFFENEMFLEPIAGIGEIPPARWRLNCFICKTKGHGALIQCHKPQCYTSFHVTCAQYAGIYMKIETVEKKSGEVVKKIALCNKHAPRDFLVESPVLREKLKNCRKILAQKRNEKSTVSVPNISPEKLDAIASFVTIDEDKTETLRKALSFWKLKRIQRNGLPLLRSLQSTSKNFQKAHSSKTNNEHEMDVTLPSETMLKANPKNAKNIPRKAVRTSYPAKKPRKIFCNPTMKKKGGQKQKGVTVALNRSKSRQKIDAKPNWRKSSVVKSKSPIVQNLKSTTTAAEKILISESDYSTLRSIRNKLESLRLLCELTKNREKHKQKMLELTKRIWDLKLTPFSHLLVNIVDEIIQKDTRHFFIKPVNVELVPDYLEIIKNPIDLSTIRDKAFSCWYDTLLEMKTDFELMINNCLLYNTKDTIYFKAAIRLREDTEIIFREAEKIEKQIGFDYDTGMHADRNGAPPKKREKKRKDKDIVDEITEFLEDNSRHKFLISEHISSLQQLLYSSTDIQKEDVRKVHYDRLYKEILELRKLEYK